MLINIVVIGNTYQHRITGRTVIFCKDVRVQAHAGNIVRQPAKHTAPISPADDGAALAADRMADIRIIKGIGIDLFHRNPQIIAFRIILLNNRFQLLPGMVFFTQIRDRSIGKAAGCQQHIPKRSIVYIATGDVVEGHKYGS